MKSKGTIMAEMARKQTNNLSKEERKRLLAAGLRIIYSNPHKSINKSK